MGVIKGEVEARELSNTVRVNELRSHDTPKKPKLPSTTSALISRESNHKKQYVYCTGSHYSSESLLARLANKCC